VFFFWVLLGCYGGYLGYGYDNGGWLGFSWVFVFGMVAVQNGFGGGVPIACFLDCGCGVFGKKKRQIDLGVRGPHGFLGKGQKGEGG